MSTISRLPKLGDVYYLAPQEGDHAPVEKGDRPYVVLSTGAAGDDVITLAYCSTRPTEATYGAAHVWVDPSTTADRACGFSRPTYVYPSRLGSYQLRDLGRLAGRLVAELPALRRELRFALGLGTGVRTELDLPKGNRRGSIVVLEDDYSEAIGFHAAVIVTEAGYSRHRRQQMVVPLLPDSEFESGKLDVVVGRADELTHISPESQTMVAATSLVTTIFEPEWIARYTNAVVDPETMHAIDEALAVHFGLPATEL